MRMTPQEALDLFRSDDLVGIGMAAHQLRKKKNDPRVATYQIDRNINYTNFCTEYCSFCAFYRPMGAKDGYVLSFETIAEKIEETIALGGTGILMQGGLNPDLPLVVLRESAALHQAALPAPASALLFGSGDSVHRRSLRPQRARHHRAPARRRTRLDSRRRRGNPRRRNSRAHLAPEMHAPTSGSRCTATRTRSACAPPPP